MNDSEEHSTIRKLTSIETKIDFLRQDYMKIFLAMLGIIGASIGLKFIGSPFLTITATYLAIFSSIFVVGATIYRWNHMRASVKTLRIAFIIFVLYSVGMRTVVFESGVTLPPIWYAPSIDAFFVIICILMLIRSFHNE